jgi:putative flippase GtrA
VSKKAITKASILKHPHIGQLLRFGVIGTSAAAVNMVGVIILVECFAWQPLWANVIAFLIAYNVSFFGHRFWTFAEGNAQSCQKFFMVACFSFIINEGLFYMLLHWVGWWYPVALFVDLLCVAVVTFIFSKFWAFKV